MSVDNPKVVDAVGIETKSGSVVLTILDSLEWGTTDHLRSLQEKLNTYFGFIESGELESEYAHAKGRTVRIDVVCRFQPDADAMELLKQARTVAETAGWVLSWNVHAV